MRGTASAVVVAGADVVIVGFFSAKEKDYEVLMDEVAEAVVGLGARVVRRFVQRRGVSDGGVKKMGLPYSSRTLVSYGKADEIAAACRETSADGVVFRNTLTDRQRRVLSEIFGCPAVSLTELA